PLLDLLITELMNAGARAAQPGEFTMRAFLGGKKDLPQAEAVAAVIEAGSADELQQALGQMAGGVTLPLNALRDDLLNLLADIEAGLDFSEEDITFVGKQDTLFRIGKGLAQLTNLLKQFETRSVNGKPFRVALVGEPNAGKSSLFNALAGLPAALVSPIAGTTRDYVSRTIQLGDLPIELIDSAGWQQGKDTIEKQAQALGLSQACSADLLLWCVDANRMNAVAPQETAGLKMLKVTTKADLSPGISEPLVTSTRTGQGIAFLKGHLLELARSFFRPALAPSLSRCRHHVEAALKHLRTAHGVVLHDDASELLALELRLALEQLGEMTGAIHTDDLLDRIFSRFCIGK
ncbi:MAG: 50S ribosome-binding GTPase, partial [Planctomycetes bacterium]|nr:50S ribosome-binding GTPase [Planctomycetota bacterium]